MRRRPTNLYAREGNLGTAVIVRRPFWFPASNYFVLSAAVTIAYFFVAWGLLHGAGEETPWITAGVGASIILAGAVILRAILMRRARQKYDLMKPGLGSRYSPQFRGRSRGKLTLEQNAAILGEIKRKSSAANVLGRLSAGHREVFELCIEYIERIESELPNMGAGSPRFAALLKGRKSASEIHRRHMLQWAELEARALTGEANAQANVEDKVKAANDALGVVEFALSSYPAEQSLVESRELLREMTVSIRVSDLVEKAEHSAFKGDLSDAVSLYRDALFYLGRDNVQSNSRRQAADHINAEIERIRLLE